MRNAQSRPDPVSGGVRFGWFALVLLAAAVPVFSQQDYVTRFDAYAGYAYFNSPHIGLAESGYHVQLGVRPATWLSLGFDYSRAYGDLTLTPDELVTSQYQTLTSTIAYLKTIPAAYGGLPSSYTLAVPAHSKTQTFAGGPQLSYRHFKKVTLFIRPDLGVMLERATPHPTAGDAFAANVAANLAPPGYKHDTVMFYGFGGGVDFNFSRHVSWRVQADFVHDHLFDDLLKDSRNTVRVSFGPAFNIGKNIVK